MLCSLVLISLLAACGGGGGGSSDAASADTTSSAAAAPRATADAPPKVTPAAAAAPASAATAAMTAAAPPAPGYYVDATSGSDSNPGSFAQPWKTLARVASAQLLSGQGLYLRCGAVWRESLVLGAAQLVDGSVVGGYGNECATSKAVISGADDFSGGWTLAGGVWSRSLPAATPKITQLFIDGQPMRTAQWPDAAAAGAAQAAVIASANSSSNTGTANGAFGVQAADAIALTGLDLTGATAQIRTHPWLIETRRVVSASGGVLQLENATAWTLSAGQGYVLQDKRWMLDQPGEFFHDLATQRLYLIAPASATTTPVNVNAALVEGSVRDVALSISQRSGVVLRDVALRAARDAALVVRQAPAIQVQRIEAVHSALAGIRVLNPGVPASAADASSVSDSLLDGNGLYGLEADQTPGLVFARNTVRNTGTGPHRVANTIAAIAAGRGARIENNVVDGAGYVGINFSAQGGSVVAGNTVSGHCARLVDCAGIYTYTGRARIVDGQASSVTGNRVSGGQAQASANDTGAMVVGIYLDDYSDGVTVADNLVVDVPVGVLLHNASRTTVRNNRLWLVRRTGIWANMDQTDGDWMRLNLFEGNQIVPVVQAQATAGALPTFTAAHAIWFWHTIEGTAALGGVRNLFRDNSVVQLQGPLAVHAWVVGGGGADTIDAARWLLFNPADKAPTRPLRYSPLLPALGPELVADSGLDLGFSQWGTWRAPTSSLFMAQGLSSRVGCAGGCISFTAGSTGDLLASRPFTLKAGGQYQYRVALATGSVGEVRLGAPYISRDVTPWDSIADAQGHLSYLSRGAAAGERLDFESFFVAKAAAPAHVNVQLETTGINVGVDTVSVREVLGYQAASPKDWARVVIAPAAGSAALSVGCAELGWPVGCSAVAIDGTAVALPLAVAPGGADRVLLRADSPYRR